VNDTLLYTQSKLHVRNETWGRYFLLYELRLQSCLHNLHLKLLPRLFCTNNATNVYVCMIKCDSF